VRTLHWSLRLSEASSSQAIGIDTPSPGRGRAQNAAAVGAAWLFRS
jgi:hypothetical protein